MCFFARDSEIRASRYVTRYVRSSVRAAALSEIGPIKRDGCGRQREGNREKKNNYSEAEEERRGGVDSYTASPLSLSFLPDSDRRWEPP